MNKKDLLIGLIVGLFIGLVVVMGFSFYITSTIYDFYGITLPECDEDKPLTWLWCDSSTIRCNQFEYERKGLDTSECDEFF